MTVMLTILLLVIILGATLKRYNITWLHQSGAALLLGLLVGFVVSYVRRNPRYSEDARETQRMTAFVEWIMFDTEFFFLVLLPPVIFESGYTLNPETLFKNFDAISVFAFLGTFTSTVVVGFIVYAAGAAGISFPFTLRDAMLFASLISSTDPVTTLSIFNDMGMDPDLHAVVLGESLLNDAISIVLFEALLSFDSGAAAGVASSAGAGTIGGGVGAMAAVALGIVDAGGGSVAGGVAGGGAGASAAEAVSVSAIGAEVAFSELALSSLGVFLGVFFASLVIGGSVGACSAILHKYISITEDWDEGWVIDSALVLIFPYLAYTIAESANLSGIVAVLFCGMVMGRYTRQNLDKAPRMVTMCFFKLVAFLSETFVFIYMGSSMCTISVTHLVTAVVALLAVFLGRAANVFPGAYLLNHTLRPSEQFGQLTRNTQLCLWYCGLRGAVAYALAMKAAATLGPSGQAMLSSTLFVVMFTVLLMGGSTSWVLQKLGIIDEAPHWGPMSPTTPDPTPRLGNTSHACADESPVSSWCVVLCISLSIYFLGGKVHSFTKSQTQLVTVALTNSPPPTPRSGRGAGGGDKQQQREPRPSTRSYRALRQFDFKYLQPLLLAVPMKRMPVEGGGGAGGGGGHGSRARGGGDGGGGATGATGGGGGVVGAGVGVGSGRVTGGRGGSVGFGPPPTSGIGPRQGERERKRESEREPLRVGGGSHSSGGGGDNGAGDYTDYRGSLNSGGGHSKFDRLNVGV